MDPLTAALAIISAIVAAYPIVRDGMSGIIGDVAARTGADPIALAKLIAPDQHEQVDATVDAIINAQWPVA